MNNEIRLSLSAAREDDSQPLHIATEGSLNQLPTKHRKGWTPAPTKPAYSQTNVSLEYKGRDYDALLRAAKRKPVGYWEDAPMGIKFGGQPLPSASTKPHGKDVDTPWPKWLIANTYLRRFDGPTGGCMVFYDSGNTGRDTYGDWDLWGDNPRVCSQAEAAQWLEQNGHEDAAAQLRGKAATAQTVAGRAWKDKYNGWHGVWLNGRSFGKSATRASFEDIAGRRDLSKDASGYEVELFGPERDAILAECCATMKLDPSTGEPLHA